MPLKTSHDEMPSINLTPMLDIVFNLIIFFMVGSRFTDLENSIDLKVPEVSTTAPLSEAPEKRVINVFSDGRIVLDRQDVSITELVDQLSTAPCPVCGTRRNCSRRRGRAVSKCRLGADGLPAGGRFGYGHLGANRQEGTVSCAYPPSPARSSPQQSCSRCRGFCLRASCC